MLTWQLVPAAREAPQVSDSVKSGFVVKGFTKIERLIGNAVAVEFVMVTVWGALVVSTTWLPNARKDGEIVIPGVMAVPLRFATSFAGGELSVTVNVPFTFPAVEGEKMSANAHWLLTE